MNLVIVESPAKAKTINKYLGKDYLVLASYGHIRDLPSKNGSVDPENKFQMEWEIDSFSKKYLKEITNAAEDSDKIILATDPDREGEAIAWHVKEVLDKKKLLKDKHLERVVFNEITKKAILDAIKNPREIHLPLVEAYLARRALDYLVGFNISPILWTKLPGSKSAGRVQSVALKLITEREKEIELFKPEEYWTLTSDFTNKDNKNIFSKLSLFDGEKIEKFSFKNKDDINSAIDSINKKKYKVTDISSKVFSRNPSGPFTTSTLQQAASSKLGFGASRTMQIAQRLYQGIDIEGDTVGLITYMRTDGTNVSKDAVKTFREYISNNFGKDYLPEIPLNYSGKKAKNAQEAHEAIRPTEIIRDPKSLKNYLSTDQHKLYNLIWSRALSSQMESAKFDRKNISINSLDEKNLFRASGSTIKFDGYLKLSNLDEKDNGDDKILPNVKKGEIEIDNFIDEQHFTQPPPRYSEASLVKKLEELGIGRPSTYASIISVLKMRSYVEVEKNRFIPEDRAILITAFLKGFFGQYVDYEFTAGMEESLDEITSGKIKWTDFLEKFWNGFSTNVGSVTDLRITNVLDSLNEILKNHIFEKSSDNETSVSRACPSEGCKGQLSLKVSRFGAFVGCSDYPECKFTRPISYKKIKEAFEDEVLGIDEVSNKEIKLLNGRFGPYVQLGEQEGKEKPQRSSVPKGVSPSIIDLDKAKYLLSLPREIGAHPESGEIITVNYGRYGGYLSCADKNASLEDNSEIFDIGINRAVDLLANAKPGRLRSSSEIKTLGEHPDDKKPVKVMKGKFGPYIKYKTINATIPEQIDPENIEMDEALDLIEKKQEKMGKKKVKKKAPKKKKSL